MSHVLHIFRFTILHSSGNHNQASVYICYCILRVMNHMLSDMAMPVAATMCRPAEHRGRWRFAAMAGPQG